MSSLWGDFMSLNVLFQDVILPFLSLLATECALQGADGIDRLPRVSHAARLCLAGFHSETSAAAINLSTVGCLLRCRMITFCHRAGCH